LKVLRPSKLGRWVSEKASGSRPQAFQTTRAISATVSSSDAETLKSSPSAAPEPIAVTIPSAMSSTCVSVRVCVPSPKIGSGSSSEPSAMHFLIRSGTACAMPGSSSGISPGP